MKPVNIIGMGYTGLPTALMLASHGVPVVGTDINKQRIDTLKSGIVPFKEQGLIELFKTAAAKSLTFSTTYCATNIYIVAVPTPYRQIDKKLDASIVVQAVESVLDVCDQGSIIIIESTISPGTIEHSIRPLVERRGFSVGSDIHLAHAPERILPGNIICELTSNARIIGVDDHATGETIKNLYASFCEGEIFLTDIKSAEMSKVVENTYRDINIAFANELAKVCHEAELDVHEIIRLANNHPRVNILSPGPGVGGHCILVDPWFLVGDYPSLTPLVLAARLENDSMPAFVLKRIREIMDACSLTNPERVGLYGLTYKENVDDIRESPTLQLLDRMDASLAPPLKTYDPYVEHDIVKNQYHNLDEFLSEIDLVVIMVAHNEIRSHADKLKNKIVYDTRNLPEFPHAYKL